MGRKDSYNLSDIKELFDKYVLPTYKRQGGNSYILKYVKGLCGKLKIPYYLSDSDIKISFEGFEKLKEVMINRWLFFNNEVEYYSSNEVAELFGCSSAHISQLVKRNILSVQTIIGTFYFSKSDIDSIVNFLSQTLGFEEIVKKVHESSNHSDLAKVTIRSYIKKYLTYFENPIDNYDIRINRGDIRLLIEKVYEFYVPKDNDFDISKVFKGKKYKYLNEMLNKENYLDIEFFKNMYEKKYKSTGFSKIVRHVVHVCKNQNVQLYVNKEMDNIYIRNEDQEQYLYYYKLIETIENSDEYYTNSEVQEIFQIKNTVRVAEYVDAIKVENKYYMSKKKIDEIVAILNNTLPTKTVMEELNVGEKTINRALKELQISYIHRGNFPILGNSHLIYKSDLLKINTFIQKERRIKKANHPYEKYKVMIEDAVFNNELVKTNTAYEKFVQDRIKYNEGQYIVNALFTIFSKIISQLSKEIMEHNDHEITEFISSLETKISKREFSFFIDFCKDSYLTKYNNVYKVELYAGGDGKNPYTFQQWIDFGGILFNTEGDFYGDLIKKAMERRGYAMSWLFCAIHYTCAWRSKDLISKLPIPSLETILKMNEEEVLTTIKSRNFTKEMARRVIISIVSEIKAFEKIPSKREKDKANPSLKFVVEESYVYQLGLLIALCEVHRRKVYRNNVSSNNKGQSGSGYGDFSSLITESATRRENHIKFFGEIYHEIFGEEGFTNQRANKTFMGIFQKKSQEHGWHIGYQMASIIRSHKPNKRGNALSTQVYLEHLNKGKDIDLITSALTERGTFGFIPYLILNTIKGSNFSELDMSEQNNEINKLLPLKPYEIERIVKESIANRSRTKDILKEIISNSSRAELLEVMKKISNGDAPSKMEHSQCLIKCIDRSACINPSYTDCIGCDFHIPEMYFLLEFREMFEEILWQLQNTKHEFDKKRLSHAITVIYFPILKEAVASFGSQKVKSFIDTDKLKESIKKLHENKQLLLG
ncbi:helix-turn-helix domain-containing protein [Sutcliffiella sp. NC1]|uniref:helix-turn-helix domain-containing protein n=1 Tax=Sutcliffiella sp. NC1 TaxID=3004096 RepID=UPI0022DE3B69|nr:helix-turn-helix domain-containing protein [Sutcliffiella sp. NC1]WBL15220.1 helix-turn-helix domain-containing protein [Sutcliffiella sp. NC1]